MRFPNVPVRSKPPALICATCGRFRWIRARARDLRPTGARLLSVGAHVREWTGVVGLAIEADEYWAENASGRAVSNYGS